MEPRLYTCAAGDTERLGCVVSVRQRSLLCWLMYPT